jgi:phosphonoacetaldehyde hydrolase
MNLARKLRMIVFDAAGTIVDPYVMASTKVFSSLLQRYHISITDGMIRQPMGKYKKDHIKDLLDNPCVQEQWKREYRRYPNNSDIECLYKQFKYDQYKRISHYGFEIPNTTNTLKQLQTNYYLTYGISTGFTRKMLDQVLDKNPELKKLINSSSTSDEVSCGRPSASMILKNMKKQNISNPSFVLKIDNTNVGIEEGHNAKSWTVGIVKYGNEMGNFVQKTKEFDDLPKETQQRLMVQCIESLRVSNPHFIIDSIEDMPQVVEQVNGYLQCGFKPKNLKNTIIISKFIN